MGSLLLLPPNWCNLSCLYQSSCLHPAFISIMNSLGTKVCKITSFLPCPVVETGKFPLWLPLIFLWSWHMLCSPTFKAIILTLSVSWLLFPQSSKCTLGKRGLHPSCVMLPDSCQQLDPGVRLYFSGSFETTTFIFSYWFSSLKNLQRRCSIHLYCCKKKKSHTLEND